MAFGRSTLFILQALLENGGDFRPHVVIDPYQSSAYHNAGLRLIRDLGLAELVEFYQEPSELVLPLLAREKRQFGLGFIDGDHRFDGVFTDFRFADLLLEPGGLMVFDDTDLEAVHLTCRFAETNCSYEPLEDEARPPAPGAADANLRGLVGLSGRLPMRSFRKPLEEPIERHQTHFVPFFENFKSRSLAEQLLYVPSRQLHHDGHMLLRRGNIKLARLYLKLALCTDPTRFKTYLRLLRTYLPQKLSRMLSKSPPQPPPRVSSYSQVRGPRAETPIDARAR
jgi:hypothetical protein